MIDRVVTGVTVFYRTPELIKFSLGSFREFYPNLPLIVVDNSGGDKCTEELEKFYKRDGNMTLIKIDKNIGHGLGLRQALKHVRTPYAYVFDSDVEILKPTLLDEMLANMKPGVYGTGYIRLCSRGGSQMDNGDLNDPEVVRYMHPLSCMINMEMYKTFSPPCSGGAPFADMMADLKDAGLTEKTLIHFPVLPSGTYIKHHGGVTRARFPLPCAKDIKDYKEDEFIKLVMWGKL